MHQQDKVFLQIHKRDTLQEDVAFLIEGMMKFKFEIQNCIQVIVEGESAEEARMELLENLSDYADEMVDGSCYVSDGVVLK